MDEFICTECGCKSDRLLTQHATNIGGKLVKLLKEGERLCPACASARGHKTLSEIHEERREKTKLEI